LLGNIIKENMDIRTNFMCLIVKDIVYNSLLEPFPESFNLIKLWAVWWKIHKLKALFDQEMA